MDRIKLLVVKVGELEQEPEGDDQDIIGRIEAYLQGGEEGASATADEPKVEAAEIVPEAAAPAKTKRRPARAKRAKEQPIGEGAAASAPAIVAARESRRPGTGRIRRV